MADKLRWGVLSTARIGRGKVIPGMLRAANCDVIAIASRDLEAAERAARELRLPRAHGSYEALLDDDEVDAVYVPLPNHMHVDWSIHCLEAGKHVLCEKPLGLDAADAQRLVDAAAARPRLRVMEALMYRFHPQWEAVRRLLQDGRVGRPQHVHSHFCYRKLDPANIRNQSAAGGGGLLDIGTYSVSLSRLLFGREPRRVSALVDVDPDLGIDRLVSALIDFGDGRTATFTCGTQMQRYQTVQVFGSDGRIQLEIPFNAPQDGPCRLWHETDEGVCETLFDRVDQYALQAEAFARAVLDGTDAPIPLVDAVANLRVIEALFESGRRGGWVALEPA